MTGKFVRIAIFRYKRGKEEYRTLNVPNLTPQEVTKLIVKIIDSQPDISVIHDKSVLVTGIEVQINDHHKLKGKIHKLAFKGLTPTETKTLLLKHIPNSFYDVKKRN